jgi:ribosomal protein L5
MKYQYRKNIRRDLIDLSVKYKNTHEVPQIEKIVVQHTSSQVHKNNNALLAVMLILEILLQEKGLPIRAKTSVST